MASFLLDHNVLPRIGRLLAERGHGVLMVREVGLATASDAEILRYAAGLRLTLLTSDNDFVNLHATSASRHTGIILVPPTPLAPQTRALRMVGEVDHLVGADIILENELYRYREGGWQHWDRKREWVEL